MDHNLNTQDFFPQKIIKVYKREHNYNNTKEGYYLELCSVTLKKGKHIVGPGKPLSKNAMRRIVGTTVDHDIDEFTENMFLDPGILRFNPLYHKRHIMWYRPQMKQEIILKKETMKIWMPAMLFFSVFDKLYLFALKQNTRPTGNTELFVAPVMNLQGADQMCWGSVDTKHKIDEIDKEMAFWEDRLWNSTFAHVGHRCTKSELLSVYKQIKKTGKKFPKGELISLDMDVDDILNKFLP